MGLYERLMHLETPHIPAHSFMAALGEYERGFMTPAQITAAFTLSPAEQTEAAALLAKILTAPEGYSLGAFVTLTNVGTAYDTTQPAKGLGFVAVDLQGITRLECRVRYAKVGSGTLSWQLWNDTDGQEVGVIDDAAAAGDNKTGSVVVTPPNPLAGGVKSIRLRVKSTVAQDDPIYYGASVFVQRVGLLPSETLHEVLLLAETAIPPLDTPAAVKARLGV